MFTQQATDCYLLHNVLGLADGRVGVTAADRVELPTDVDVILLQTNWVAEVHHHPVAAGARQTGGGSTKTAGEMPSLDGVTTK